MDYDDCFGNFDVKESEEIVCSPPITSSELLEKLSLQSLVEETFYIQCRKLNNSDKVSIHVCELGRHKIRVYGYYCAEAKDLETSSSLDLCMESIALKGYRDKETDMFVVKPHDFREKNIMFEGTMPPVVPFEVEVRQTDSENSSTRVVDPNCHSTNLKSQDTSPLDLGVAAVTELMNIVEQSCPGLMLSGSTANNSQTSLPLQFQSPVKPTTSSTLESPSTIVFGRQNPLCEPLTPENGSSTTESDMAFSYSSQSQRLVSSWEKNRSPTPPCNWGAISLHSATNQYAQPQRFSHQAKRSLHFPSAAQASRQALPSASSAANFAPAALPANKLNQASPSVNYASSMLAINSLHAISRVSVQIVQQQPATSHSAKPSVNSHITGYAKMFQSTQKPQPVITLPLSVGKISEKQVVESPSAVVARNSVVSPVHTSVDDNIIQVNGIPCFYNVKGDGTRQLMVCRDYFIRPTKRYMGSDCDWIFLRDSNDSASYYRETIEVDPEKVKIPGYSNYEIVKICDEPPFYRVNPSVIRRKVCDVKQDVFPFFYKNSTQYRKLSDEEKKKYVECNDGPKPPFENAVYSAYYYLKEIHANDLFDLEMGYCIISRYYRPPPLIGNCNIHTFCMETYKEVMQTIAWQEKFFAKELREERERAQKRLPPVPKKVREDEDSVKFAEKHGNGKKQSRKSSGSTHAKNASKRSKKLTSSSSSSDDSSEIISFSDLDNDLEVEGTQKEKDKKGQEEPTNFYELCARMDRGEKVFPENKLSKPSSKRMKKTK